MTAEAQVHCELSEIKKVAMEEKSGLDVSSHEELSKVGGDCNGVNNPVDGVNVSAKDDPDGSYVFVSANGDLIDRDLNADGAHKSHVVSKLEDLDDQVPKLNGENGKIAPDESNCIGEGTDDAPPVGKPVLAGVDVLVQGQSPTAIVESECEGLNGDATPKEIELDSASDIEQNQEFPITVSEVDHSGTPLLNGGKIESQEQININSAAESGEVRECQVLVSEVDDIRDGEEKPEKQNTVENSHLMEGEEAQTAHSEPSDCESSLLDEGKLNSEGHANVVLSTELEGSQESQVMVSEATECKVPEVEVQLDDGKIESEEKICLNSTTEIGEESQVLVSEVVDLHDGEEKHEKQNTITNGDFRESEEAEIVYPEPSECESSNNDDSNFNPEEIADMELSTVVEGSKESQVMASEVEIRKVIAENQVELESPQEVKESLEVETPKVESAESELQQLDYGDAKLEEEEKADLTLNVKEDQESAESESQQLDYGDVKLEEEEKADLTSDVKEDQECLLLVTDNLNTGTEEVGKVANETVPLEAETADEHVLDESNDSCPTCVEGGTQAQVLNEPIESVLCCPAEDAEVEIEYNHGTVEGNITASCKEVSSGTETDLLSVNPEGKVCTSSSAEVNTQSEVLNRVIDCASKQPIAVNSLDPEYHATDELQNGSGTDMKSESQVGYCPPISARDLPCSDGDISRSEVVDCSIVSSGSDPSYVPKALNVQDDGDQVNGGDGDQVNGGDGDNLDNHKCQNVDALDEKIADGLNEQSSDALDEQSARMEGVKRPFNFLIKVPRYDDENLRKQIKHAQQQVVDKTRLRDAIRDNIQMTTSICQKLRDSREAARSEARGARELVNAKRQEIDSVQFVINRVKNAISVKEMNVRINNMEHMIQHETLPLKEEKDLIRQIKQLTHLRKELSSNMGNQDEVQQALDQRDQSEERLKMLKKELDSLKVKVSKTQETTSAAEKRWNDESKKLKELQAQFRVADEVRQKAYAHLQNLKKQLYEKNSQFRKYKDDTTAAYEYASNQDKDGLHRLCFNQVETIMDLWNKDDEYRKEYLRCNTRSMLWRFRTSDGRALGPDEEPTVLPNSVDNRSLPTPSKENSELPIFTLEQEKQGSTVRGEVTDGKSTVNLVEQRDQTANTKKPGKPTLRTGVETVSGRDKAEEMLEEEHKQTKEEQELARKKEELRKEEAAVKLKEQQRREEKAKAKEALERKRRNAEKAQVKAELRAQKEAEQKEKEREKKAKKKERKKAVATEGPDSNNEGETVPTSESPPVATKEPNTEGSPVTITKRPQKVSQFTNQSKTKSIPPPLRNRGRRRMQQWIWIILTVVVVLVLFLLGNIGFYSNLGHNLRNRHHGI